MCVGVMVMGGYEDILEIFLCGFVFLKLHK